MRTRCAIAVMFTLLGSLSMHGPAFAHGTKEHGTKKPAMKPADAQMEKLHAMMPIFSIASANLETALEKEDITTARAEAGKIFAALPDLKKSKPHRNFKQQKKFVALATNLEQALAATVDLAAQGDFTGAKTAFKKVEEACAACHAKFR